MLINVLMILSLVRDKQVIEYDHYGGSGTEIFTLKYQIGKTIERTKELKERFGLNSKIIHCSILKLTSWPRIFCRPRASKE